MSATQSAAATLLSTLPNISYFFIFSPLPGGHGPEPVLYAERSIERASFGTNDQSEPYKYGGCLLYQGTQGMQRDTENTELL